MTETKKEHIDRISKTNYYLDIAQAVAKRGTCLRRNFGAVIVKDDRIVATGYTGAPRGSTNCIDEGTCNRELLAVKPGERYELCRSVHAEQNAIIHASAEEMKGATLYLVGLDAKTGAIYTETAPCLLCKRIITNAGIQAVVARVGVEEDEYTINEPSSWVILGEL